MNTKLLIDSIVQQTTVLIAQLSTAAGVRAPLAHVADEIFVSLAKAIEEQGVGRKVVADMFGLALRTYQRKVQRLTESATLRERTLWEAVLELLTEKGATTKADVCKAFPRDEERRVLAVLSDLVQSGLIFSSGKGQATLYRVTSDTERQTLGTTGDADALATAVWATVFHQPGIVASEVAERFRVPAGDVDAAIDALLRTERIRHEGLKTNAALFPTSFVIPPGAESGWEAAVFDHFQAMVKAIIKKLDIGQTLASERDIVGGSTFHFSVHDQHPLKDEVLANLERVRGQMSALYERVTAHNRAHPIDEARRTRVTFYFGQGYTEPPGGNGGGTMAEVSEQGGIGADES